MGHNDHIDWDLHANIATLVMENMLEEDSLECEIALKVAEQGLESLTAAETQIWVDVVTPLLEQVEEIENNYYLEHLLSKDD